MNGVIDFFLGAATGSIAVWLLALYIAHVLDKKDET